MVCVDRPYVKHFLERTRPSLPTRLRPDADGDVVEQRLRQLLFDGGDVGFREVGAQQPHAAVYVKPDAARRHDRRWVGRVERGDVADGEAVAGVQVGHGQGGAHDAGQGRDVGDLFDGWEEAAAAGRRCPGHRVCQLAPHERAEGVVDVEDAGDAHAGDEARRDGVLDGGELGDEGELLRGERDGACGGDGGMDGW